jgi:hypothetical protein
MSRLPNEEEAPHPTYESMPQNLETEKLINYTPTGPQVDICLFIPHPYPSKLYSTCFAPQVVDFTVMRDGSQRHGGLFVLLVMMHWRVVVDFYGAW